MNYGRRSRRRGHKRLGPAALSVSLWLTLILGAPASHQPSLNAIVGRSATNNVSSAAAARPTSVTATALPVFRLGTAARPFGWSTTVGYLNTDGTPDLVIADRASHKTGGYTYWLQFAVSGLEPRQVQFDSRQDALNVGMSDVDHDGDFDVVVSAVLSREVVGIWLNDGGGRFQATDIRQFPSYAPPLQSISTGHLWVDSAPSEMPPRRAADALPARVPSAVALSTDRLPKARADRLHGALASTAAAPRGPPSQPA